jgi:hypothetical protein
MVRLSGKPEEITLFVPDDLPGGTCPGDLSENDEIVPTDCPDGVSKVLVDPEDGSLVYRCAFVPGETPPGWVVENGLSSPPPGGGDIVALGPGGMKVVFRTGQLAILDGDGEEIGALPSDYPLLGAYRMVSGGLISAQRTNPGEWELWDIRADGSAARRFVYAPADEGFTDRSQVITEDGTLWQVRESAEETMVVKRTQKQTEVVYSSRNPPSSTPYVQVYASSLLTGP